MYFPGDVKPGHNIHVCSFYTHIQKSNNNSHTAEVQALDSSKLRIVWCKMGIIEFCNEAKNSQDQTQCKYTHRSLATHGSSWLGSSSK